MASHDAVIVGSGPNGLAAAIALARTGRRVLVIEGQSTVGGGARSAELTLPGFVHDICSAIHPLTDGSPFLKTLPLADYGLKWIQPDLPLAHPLDDGRAVVMYADVEATAQTLGQDARAWRSYFGPMVTAWDELGADVLTPLRMPKHPVLFAQFALRAGWPADLVAKTLFRTETAQALFAGMAAHAIQPLGHLLTASFGLMLGVLGQAVGWPFPAGGAQAIPDAMTAYLRALGGEVVAGWMVTDLAELPPAPLTFLDISPRSFLHLAGERLPSGYRRQLTRYRYGPGVFKVDYALAGPVPWRADACRRAGTVHVGGTLGEIVAAERETWRGGHPQQPYVLVAQQSLFDPSRAPAGQHTLWAYCHVPNGSTVDMTAIIDAQIERFAPGFRDLILARAVHNTAQMEAYNPNYVGGDINVGVQNLAQMWTRPSLSLTPYRTPLPGVYLCSSATPPGGGVHGMAGYHAVQAALMDLAA